MGQAVEPSAEFAIRSAEQEAAVARLEHLTAREWQIMDMIVAGQPNKNIAADLGVSQRTVEHHRQSIMKKTGSHSVAALVQLARMMVEPG
jgi:two-component system CheB/CheR fusion protein